MGILQKLLSGNPLKPIEKIADEIEAFEPKINPLTDAELRAKTDEFRARLQQGESLDSLLPEAYAVVREASVRTTGMKHYRVQLIGGVVLHQGRIAEMKTGEGKTLVATLPAYLNALGGNGVHIVTVNDYLARRDSEWMGKIYRFLGMEVGLIVHDMDPDERRRNYNADITYGTNNEYGFDYLRDNMVIYRNQMVQRELNFAIVDEVDSILIDEARTPLIISGMGTKSTEMYERAQSFMSHIKEGEEEDYVLDEKRKAATLTEKGARKAEAFFGVENLSDVENTELNHHINQALKADKMFKLDVDYVVQDGAVKIVDEFTGRIMEGRRYSEGLHQAIEAKEKVKVERESKTLATITFQNYFRMYNKLSGMTGTAKTEEDEFKGIYGLDVVVIPTAKDMIRKDENDVVFVTEDGKFTEVISEIASYHEQGRPILVGTVSVEKSEKLSRMLRRQGIEHSVLNAKNHEKEAEIVAQAGKYGAVTIATNMAGRGTDILLGGNPDFLARQDMRRDGYEDDMIENATSHAETDDQVIHDARKRYSDLFHKHSEVCDAEHDKVVAVGGLHIIGTERHESRRIDNQLRGRAGRQGDPGSSRFYIALEDDLMRLFGGERVQSMMERLSPDDDIPMDIGMLSRQIENAQKRIESRNYEIRKHVLQYDDVMNQQREIIYKQRRGVLMGEDVHDSIMDMLHTIIDNAVDLYCVEGASPEDWDFAGLNNYMAQMCFHEGYEVVNPEQGKKQSRDELKQQIRQLADEAYASREQEITEVLAKLDPDESKAGEKMRELERTILLRAVDSHWMDHIDDMDQLRQNVGLRAYGQHDPVVEYKMQGYDMFEAMIEGIQEETVKTMYHARVATEPQRRQVAREAATPAKQATEGWVGRKTKKNDEEGVEVGRNEPCPCKSGKKFKNCHGKDGSKFYKA